MIGPLLQHRLGAKNPSNPPLLAYSVTVCNGPFFCLIIVHNCPFSTSQTIHNLSSPLAKMLSCAASRALSSVTSTHEKPSILCCKLILHVSKVL